MKNLIAISAPSGSGKTTLCRRLQKNRPDIEWSVSYTTREKRKTESDGRDYNFITKEQFEDLILNKALAEWENVHGYYYGTPKATLDTAIKDKVTLLLELDVKGAMSVKELYPEQTLSIFVKPPSEDVLRLRLESRGTDDKALIKKRLTRIHMELEYGKMFDVSFINDDLKMAIKELKHIILTELKGKIHEY